MFNKPDLILADKNTKQTTLIDVAGPNNNHLRDKHNDKIPKNKDLEIRIQSQWKIYKVQTIPIIISTTGTISKDHLMDIKLLGSVNSLISLCKK